MAAKWDLDKIHECIRCTDDERNSYNECAALWENMYDLDYWTGEQEDLAEIEKRRLVTTSWPRTSVNLARRLIEDKPKINVGSRGDGDDLNAKARERFLTHLWDRQRLMQKMPPVAALKYSALVLGKMCLQVVWIGNKKRYPILIRPLRPDAVGVEWGPDGPLWAYHTYQEKTVSIKVRYPKAKLGEWEDKDELTVTDFWYQCQSGSSEGTIYNAVLAGQSYQGEFLKKPEAKKEYPIIPILCALNDPDFRDDPAKQANGLLSAMGEDWSNANLSQSFLMTGMEGSFWPKQFIEEGNVSLPDNFEVNEGPGEWTVLPNGARYREAAGAPDTAILQQMVNSLDAQQQRALFSNVLYGDNQGIQAGYAIGNLANAASSRVHMTLYQLETLMEDANTLALCLAEKFGPASGIDLWGYEDELAAMASARIKPDQISGFYHNHVQMSTNIVGDEMQKAAIGLQEVGAQIISKRTYREDKMVGQARCDEEEQIIGERAMEDPDVFRALAQRELLEQGIDVPPNEPDGRDTLAEQQQMAMQQQAQMGQPQQVMPNNPLPPELQGQLVPESFGMPRQGDPAAFQQMLGRELTPEELLAIENGTFNT